ncbi:MAG: LON peptidase substrate-binding domain-containing protein, partial [Thermomicrobiaceae bacterium]|nr:LON peptidase substrate-binding domain-containing protein [Thermomicrobiaceae bacterium]
MVERFRDEQLPAEQRSEPEAEPAVTGEQRERLLPILPLRGTVVFPLTLVPLAAGQPRSLRLIDEVVSGDRTVGLVLQKDPEQEGAGPGETYEIGTI